MKTSDTYYRLYANKKWLAEGDNPEVIGGRHTEITQIGFSLELAIKNLYPMNKIPEPIASYLSQLEIDLANVEERIQKFIDMVSQDVMYRNK